MHPPAVMGEVSCQGDLLLLAGAAAPEVLLLTGAEVMGGLGALHAEYVHSMGCRVGVMLRRFFVEEVIKSIVTH